MTTINIELEVTSNSWDEVVRALEVFQKLLPGSVVTIDRTGIGSPIDDSFRALFIGSRPDVAKVD